MNNLIITYEGFKDISTLVMIYEEFTNKKLLDDTVKVLTGSQTVELLTDYYLSNGKSPCITCIDKVHLATVELDKVLILYQPIKTKELTEMIMVLESNNNIKKEGVIAISYDLD